jgi:CRISPR-associated protein Csd2
MPSEIPDLYDPTEADSGVGDDVEREDDVAYTPGPTEDPPEIVNQYISQDIRDLYDVHSYRHAAAIFRSSYPIELDELEKALREFKLTTKDIGMPGGNESIIPKKFSNILRPLGWKETRIQGDLLVRLISSTKKKRSIKPKDWERADVLTVKNIIDGHKIDYVKGKVAFDLEWNSKDQTFDRDLYAFRLFHEASVISVAALVTRSEKLNPVFEVVPIRKKKTGEIIKDSEGNTKPVMSKYGATTTFMGKLRYRLNAGRNGGCPVLVFGIRPDVIEDWPLMEEK